MIIETRDLKKVYRTDAVETTAVDGLDFSLDEGQFVSIMGPSGCGKSTLLHILGLIDSPTEGSYRFLGEDVSGYAERRRAGIRKSHIGFVFQSFNLIDELTVYENVELPLVYGAVAAHERRGRVEAVLEKMDIGHRSGHFPAQLSGGQQQRVAVARAIVTRPNLILADEPTGNLDSEHGEEVMKMLTRLNDEGTTILMVTHSAENAAYSRRIVNLIDGRIVSDKSSGRERMRNYIIVALRNLRRERLYAAINIAGLSLGIACCLILGLFLRSELTYDRYNVQHDHIFRVVNEFTTAGTNDRFAATSRSLGPMLKDAYPQIRNYVRFESAGNQGGIAIHHGSDTYFWENAYYVDQSVFDVFTFNILYGDPRTALKDGSSVAVSQTFARRYFGNTNPIGESITTDDGIPLKIDLVYADQPINTHLKYDVLFSRNNPRLVDPDNQTQRRNMLWNIGDYTYLLIAPGFKVADWAHMSDEFYTRNMADLGKRLNSHWRSWLQPLTEIHLQSDVGYDRPTGNRLYLYGCAAVALFILAVACINYMNLATARATRRARSVGIRKILGASRLSLALQFLGEAILFALIASVLGMVIVEVILRFTPINSLMEQQVTVKLLHAPALMGSLVGLAVLVGILAGAYPAVYLSSWAPLSALTGRYTAGKGHGRMRELLVLLQFTISAAVIACTLLMQGQMRYIANKPLGFHKENRLVVTLRGASTIEKIPTIRTELGKNAHILGVTEAITLPGQVTGVNLLQADNNDGVPTSVSVFNMPVATDFVSVMGLQIVRGRDFSQRLLTDTGISALVNETMVHKMGWIEPLGKRIQAGGPGGPIIRVIGVVKDFNFKSLHTVIEPFGMLPLSDDFTNLPQSARPSQQRLLVLNIKGEDVGQTLDFVSGVIRQADARHPFEYAFLDQQLDNLYKAEHNLTRLIGIFAGICIFIACLGLFGLVAFTTEQRSREIGTRKVLGATTLQIILLLSQRILLLVLIASVIAAALSYLAMDKWLAGFAYRTGINPLVFVLAAILAAGVAFITVALQSYRTASADPVHALREE